MHRRLTRILTIILMTHLAPSLTGDGAAQTPPAFAEAWDAVRDGYTATLREHGIVGSSLLFMRDGDVLAWETYGFADRETRRAVDRETIYHWASITKTFTGIAVLQLRDRGLLSLDDPVAAYLPELEAVHDPYGDVRAVTLRHLMSHTAGFRSPTWPWGGDKPWHPHEPTEWAQLVAMMPYTEVEFEPGSRYQYSNLGIIFLGRIVERLTGDDYEVYVDKNILKPLEMYRSYFDRTPYHLLPYRSNNYSVRDGEAVPDGLDFDTGITVSNGGLNAPLGDMARYLAFLTGGADPAQQSVYDGVLARRSLEEMWQPRYEVARRGPFTESVGLCFFVMEKEGFRVVGHTGSQKAFLSFFYVDPAARTGVLAAFNTAGDGPDPKPDTRALMEALRERVFEEIFPLFR